VLAPRLLVFIAILMGLSVVAGSLRVPEPVAPESDPLPAAEAREEQRETISAADRGQRIEASVGVPLHLEVTGERTGAVQIGPGGPIDAFHPESPARFDLRVTDTGEREVFLLEPRRAIARITFRK